MTYRFLPLFALGLLTGSLAACGGDDDDTPGSTAGSQNPGGSSSGQSGQGGGGGTSGTSGHGGAGQAGTGQAGAGQAGAGQAGAGKGGAGQAGAGQGGAAAGSGGQAGYGLTERPANPTCRAPARPVTSAAISLEAFPSASLKFSKPVFLLQAPGNTTRFYVVQKTGQILSFEGAGATKADKVLDISKLIDSSPNEAGLLGVAFHPKFAQNGQVFLSFDVAAGTPSGIRSRIARYTSPDGGKTIDPNSAKTLLEIDQPYENHNGGMLAFGPDGRLYASFGDGGSGGDPQGNGQNTNVLLGKILRIDVDSADPYGIPADNPFAQGGGRGEIFAYGVRNTWRFSFDRATGDLWAGDVGQDKYEEVDVIKLGGNYGWNTMEGFHCYNAATCNQAGLTLPVVEYDHGVGQSITGGYVYRGQGLPALAGRYLYGDYVTGKLWGTKSDAVTGATTGELLLETGLNISSFGQDAAGEVYVLNYNGSLHKIVAKNTQEPDTFPKTLSATGCVDPTDATKPAGGLIPYGVNAPFWSDGAEKQRWFALPDSTQITVDAASGDMDLPTGSVVVKEFKLGGKRIETRLFVRHDDGAWAGYSYEWNDAGTDATYVPGGKTKVIGSQTWLYPSSAQCLQCHTEAAGRTLGLEVAQLNGSFAYPGGHANQLTTLDHLKLFTAPLAAPVAQLPALPDPQGTASLEDRTKSHLHTNCSFCHRPGGTGGGNADYRFVTPFAQMNLCNATPTAGDLGVADARVIKPGDPSHSLVSIRTHTLDSRRMPPLGSNVVDTAGVTLIDSFISSLKGCP